MNKKNIIFTGGGSGGHVIPALTLCKQCMKHDVNIFYIGSHEGVEKKIIKKEGITYKAISTGKLRRYFSFKNFVDIFRIIWGTFQSYCYLMKFKKKETVIVGTGGFVIVPVVFSAWLQGKKIIIHEQTSRIGLANKISSYFATKVLVTFGSSVQFFPEEKVIESGYPLREEIFLDNTNIKVKGLDFNNIDKPILFITGGGNGSFLLNNVIKELRTTLLNKYFIIHQVGKTYYEEYLKEETKDYKVFDFITKDIISYFKRSDVIISRAGAGTVVELMAIGKPSILVPLEIAQKNEQYHNAMEANDKVGSIVIEEKYLTNEKLLYSIEEIQKVSLSEVTCANPAEKISKIILEL
jgi:UDP-N-acetylglucosamine--N-acetylmuramyl-(pentapeptide) pyrophosphoryl-undecaprenol N-acetylglucosamine transferase